jgi:adenosylhomocysteine nucleosidase
VITGIVIALTEELSTLTTKRLEKGGICYLTNDIWVVYSGAGDENARLAAESLVNKGANRLISWGCAAALEANLQPGNLVLATSCIDAQQVVFELDNKDWINALISTIDRQITVHVGRIAESNHVVETSQNKVQFRNRTGAIALDMESTAIAKVANLNGIPFMTFRVIADSLMMDLPKAVSYALNDQGDVILSKLLYFLLLHPSELPSLVKLGTAFSAAKKTLKRVAKDIDVITRYGESEISASTF